MHTHLTVPIIWLHHFLIRLCSFLNALGWHRAQSIMWMSLSIIELSGPIQVQLKKRIILFHNQILRVTSLGLHYCRCFLFPIKNRQMCAHTYMHAIWKVQIDFRVWFLNFGHEYLSINTSMYKSQLSARRVYLLNNTIIGYLTWSPGQRLKAKSRIFGNDNLFLNGTFFSDSTINALIGPETDFHFVFIVSPVSSSLDLKRTLFTLSLRSLMSDD